ncbi:PTS transporter subunit EIIC [Amphibacillus cookii]|uniref:PTS transporter subunit EIIC n=1 Tax=Amphibacillus cookii TaxID=767787 RepID=UPI001956427E|nr:PTS transporter subunit EIIC [Amphibacillus cookii]MBM7542036.1 PTS system maltose and glucose-specific IIC component [Amphibacillus cookii]
MKDQLVEFGQRLGKAILLPVAILPVAGLLLGVSAALSGDAVVQTYPILDNTALQAILRIMNAAGSGVFNALPLIFAIGIAVGLARREKGAAGLASVVGYFVLIITINALLDITGQLATADIDPRLVGQGAQFGIMTLQMGVFGGILAGIITGLVHNRFYNIKLPEFLAFFGGSRFVPILNTLVFLIVGSIMFILWPFIGNAISAFGEFATGLGTFGAFLYGLMLRTLYLFGLHHVFYLPFWTTAAGGTLEVGGEMYEGFQTIFLAQLSDPNTTQFFGNLALFNSGRYFHMMAGMIGIVLAMYKTIPKGPKRKATSGFLLSIGLTAFITGVTEPISFALLFASPILFIAEAILFASSFVLASLFNITIGSTFSAGLVEFLLFGVFQGNDKTNYLWIILLSIPVMFVYYFVFKKLILKLNAKTPGRDDEEITDEEKKLNAKYETGQAHYIVEGLGGFDNITDIDNCATRLRVSVKKPDQIDAEALKKTGAMNTVVRGKAIQVIYGPKVNIVRTDIDEYIDKNNIEHLKQK